MRVIKEPDVRRNEILDAAEELFAKKGFDNTSTNDILEKCGIARGTLYYHFKSKEDILDGVIDRITEQAIKRAQVICEDKTVPVLSRFTAAILSLSLSSDIGREVTMQMNKPQNALMHQKAQDKLMSGVVPVISGLVREGTQKKIFRTDYPEEAVEMLLLYSNVMLDGDEGNKRRIPAFIYNTERLLGTENGALLETMMTIFGGNKDE